MRKVSSVVPVFVVIPHFVAFFETLITALFVALKVDVPSTSKPVNFT